MRGNGRFVAALSPCGHDVPNTRAEDSLRHRAILGAPAQFNEVFAEMRAVKADDAQPPLNTRGVLCHASTLPHAWAKNLINLLRYDDMVRLTPTMRFS